MASDELEESLRVFLLDHVYDFEQLEVLLFVYRQRTREWGAHEMARELALPESAVLAALEHLRSRGLVGQSPRAPERYLFEPATLEIREQVESLARAREERRLSLIQVMSANAMQRLRSSALRTFAEAFRVRGPKKNG